MVRRAFLGMRLEDIIRAVTSIPACLMGMDNKIGTIQEGAFADVCIAKIEEHAFDFVDSKGERRSGNKMLISQATIANGEIVYLAPLL